MKRLISSFLLVAISCLALEIPQASAVSISRISVLHEDSNFAKKNSTFSTGVAIYPQKSGVKVSLWEKLSNGKLKLLASGKTKRGYALFKVKFGTREMKLVATTGNMKSKVFTLKSFLDSNLQIRLPQSQECKDQYVIIRDHNQQKNRQVVVDEWDAELGKWVPSYLRPWDALVPPGPQDDFYYQNLDESFDTRFFIAKPDGVQSTKFRFKVTSEGRFLAKTLTTTLLNIPACQHPKFSATVTQTGRGTREFGDLELLPFEVDNDHYATIRWTLTGVDSWTWKDGEADVWVEDCGPIELIECNPYDTYFFGNWHPNDLAKVSIGGFENLSYWDPSYKDLSDHGYGSTGTYYLRVSARNADGLVVATMTKVYLWGDEKLFS